MSKTRFLSIILAVVLVIGCVPSFALAAEFTDVDYSTELVLDTAYEGVIEATDPYIGTYKWSGYAKGFNAELEAGEYKIVATVSGESATYIDRAVSVMKASDLGNDPSVNRIAYTENWADTDKLTTTLVFTIEEAGVYNITIWGYCEDADNNELNGETTSVSVLLSDDITETDRIGMPIAGELVLGTAYEGIIEETDPYIDTADWGGYAKVFKIELDEGVYSITAVVSSDDAFLIDRAISVMSADALGGDPSADGVAYSSEVTEGSTKLTQTLDFVIEEAGVYYVYVWGFCEDVDGVTLYGEGTSVTVLAEEVETIEIDINSVEDLVGFNEDMLDAKYDGKYPVVNFLNDIDMTDIAWDDDFYSSVIKVNGNGHTVANLGGALLGEIEIVMVNDLDMVADLTFTADPDVSTEFYNFGLYVNIAKEVRFNNCHVKADLAFDGYSLEDIGMFVGDVKSFQFDGCSAEGSITGTGGGYIGGFLGYAWSSGKYSFVKNSYANVNIDITSGYGSVGGIAGSIEDDAVFENVYAIVDINVPDGVGVGGLVGYVDEANTFTNCYAEGTVIAKSSVGGLVGDSSCCGNNDFVNCYSTVDVTGKICIGGFIGEVYSYDNFENCYSAGTVTYSGTEEEYNETVGTFFGYSDYTDVGFLNCFAAESDTFGTFGYFGGEVELGDILTVDFADDEAVQAMEDALNEYVEGSDVLYAWGDRNDKNGPLFVVPQFLPGDVNADGSVDVFDYMMVKSHYFKKYTLTDAEFARADLVEDGIIDVFDYMAVKQKCFNR